MEIVQNRDSVSGPGVGVPQTPAAPPRPPARPGDPDDTLLGLGERQGKKVSLHPSGRWARLPAGRRRRALDTGRGEGPETHLPHSTHSPPSWRSR
eukprot:1980483-Pyramimonas_sp.AAC.1